MEEFLLLHFNFESLLDEVDCEILEGVHVGFNLLHDFFLVELSGEEQSDCVFGDSVGHLELSESLCEGFHEELSGD